MTTNRVLTAALLGFWLSLAPAFGRDTAPLVPTEVEGLEYSREFFPGIRHDPAVPTPEELLGFPIGRRATSPEEIERCLKAWDAKSPRTRLVEYARSHEGRALYTMILSSPRNLERLDEIKAGLAQLADPRELEPEDADGLLESLPAVGWLAYSIHGDEVSGCDAALALIHHLAAADDEAVATLLDELVVIIDPMENPDGRARFVKQLDEQRGTMPDFDPQSVKRESHWAWGRVNHYLFDLNRDWALGVHPESRGRIRAVREWHPLLFVDAHEMGFPDTYLFSPQHLPLNPHLSERKVYWNNLFARDQAAAFDRFGWVYYTGEWNEGWYPGYSDAWASFLGAVGILYEQSRISEGALRDPAGPLVSYREAVHHQLTSSLANLATLRAHAAELKREFLAQRQSAVGAKGSYANRTFAVLPSANHSRIRGFAELMELQGIEVYEAAEEFVAEAGRDQLGRELTRRKIPRGTLLVPNRQPEARLAAVLLEFDHPMPEEYLRRERQALLRRGRSTIYDLTAWNLTMLYGLEALTLDSDLPAGAVRLDPSRRQPPTPLTATETAIAYVIDGADDLSVAAAARLLERGVEVRVTNREFVFDEQSFARGSVVVTRIDNGRFAGDLAATVKATAAELGLEARGVDHGLGEGELPDIGGRHFIRLEPPRIAVLARGGVHPYDFGSIWFTLDHRLGIRHSHLNDDQLGGADLRPYNVLVLPERFGDLPEPALAAIKPWVEAGGTLIAIGRSAAAVAGAEPGLSQVRQLPDVLAELDQYELAVLREWLAASDELPSIERLWSHSVEADPTFPWQAEKPRADEKTLARQDQWQRIFMPQGAILAGRVDQEHWLTFGCDAYLPVLIRRNPPVLMAKDRVEAPIRLGYYSPLDSGGRSEKKAEAPGTSRVGWAAVPEGQELRLRMSGLLWPEASHRLAHSAFVTREAVGRGQVILFAASPTFRGATMGTARILTHALIYGPGLGTRPALIP
ncbi:MAG: peptidase [bacterium]|nr:peptidase [bacterium]